MNFPPSDQFFFVSESERSAFGNHSVGLLVKTSSQVPIMSSRTRSSGGGLAGSSAETDTCEYRTARETKPIIGCSIERFLDEYGPSPPPNPLTCRAGCKERDVSKNRNAGPVK